MIIKTPTKYFFVTGTGEGSMPLNAFDGALLDSGAGNCNLVRMSSILPPFCQQIEPVNLPFGALVPVAYGSITSALPGEKIAAGVAIGIPKDESLPGLIMEYSARGHKEDIEEIVCNMADEGLKKRGFEIKKIKSAVIEHTVELTGAVFAGVVLWD